MRLRVRDIEETTKEVVYDESTSELNPLLEHGPVHDFAFVGPATVPPTCKAPRKISMRLSGVIRSS